MVVVPRRKLCWKDRSWPPLQRGEKRRISPGAKEQIGVDGIEDGFYAKPSPHVKWNPSSVAKCEMIESSEAAATFPPHDADTSPPFSSGQRTALDYKCPREQEVETARSPAERSSLFPPLKNVWRRGKGGPLAGTVSWEALPRNRWPISPYPCEPPRPPVRPRDEAAWMQFVDIYGPLIYGYAASRACRTPTRWTCRRKSSVPFPGRRSGWSTTPSAARSVAGCSPSCATSCPTGAGRQ